MVLRLEDKKAIVAEVSEIAQASNSAIIAEYRGLTVEQLTKLRAQAKKSGIYIRIVRNTLARRALTGTLFACMQEMLKGPLMLSFSKEDPGILARLMRDFAKDNEKLVIKALSMDGQLLLADALDRVANLPTRDQALSLLLSVMKAPITQLVRTIGEPCAKFVRTVAAVADQKQQAAV